MSSSLENNDVVTLAVAHPSAQAVIQKWRGANFRVRALAYTPPDHYFAWAN